MMLTELEAKKKWCQGRVDIADKCVGSDCMAWRWGEESNDLSYNCHGKLVDGGPLGANRKGFCGLAGAVAYT